MIQIPSLHQLIMFTFLNHLEILINCISSIRSAFLMRRDPGQYRTFQQLYHGAGNSF